MSDSGPEKAMEHARPTGFRCSGCREVFSFMEEGEPPLVLGVLRATEPGARVPQHLEVGFFCEACEESFVDAHDYVQIIRTDTEAEDGDPDAEHPPQG